ncbi:oxidoreductase domain protein [Beutenbergia cavernae DSM 12333]|uniref:Oxidoreductase domain protein n=1 Tax=Beutenbergia cavernae (strain ATCC BAA-8 / DSM 12333 / CCUG 43141 / JCM 11478 / NBRC 16432 / NCIMB 13614 / HKI 0122) TaxID=471853 RepID=C5BY26_BEUC1|nr:Gfo/Idh/MocA family oxidoreductase [Beutenbergia cavernae]ACQ78920.1 oxidoreductase domain protein [Beutenbergia cavernae DSM 12333]
MTDPTPPDALLTSATAPDPMDAPPLRWGILAPGGIAQNFARTVPEHTRASVIAVGSRSLERAESFATEFGIRRAYGSYSQLVEDDDVDAVYVASPHSEHRAHALLAIRAGKPVLVEKAFTRNAAEAREVFDAAEQAGLYAMEAMWSRFLPHYAAVREIVASGEIGDVVSVTAQHGQRLVFGPEHRLWNPALAGGAVLDLAVYPISFVHMLLGVPDEVLAVGSLSDLGVDEGETVLLRYGARTVAVAEATMLGAMPNTATITGTAGRVEIPRTFYVPNRVVVTPLDGEPRVVHGEAVGGFQFQAAEAARRIAAGELESPTLTWAATLEVMEIMDEVRRQLGVVYPGE